MPHPSRHPCDTWASAFAGGGFVTFGLSAAAERAAVAFEARRAAYVARYCTNVAMCATTRRPHVVGAALVREAAVTALMAEEGGQAVAAALEPRPDVALTAADAAGHPPDDSESDSSSDRWEERRGTWRGEVGWRIYTGRLAREMMETGSPAGHQRRSHSSDYVLTRGRSPRRSRYDSS